MCRFKVIKRSRCLCLLRTYMRAEDEISKKLFPGLLSHGLLRKSKTNKLERSTTGGRYVNRPLLHSFPIDDGKNNNTTTSSAKQQRETTPFAALTTTWAKDSKSFFLVSQVQGCSLQASWTVFRHLNCISRNSHGYANVVLFSSDISPC